MCPHTRRACCHMRLTDTHAMLQGQESAAWAPGSPGSSVTMLRCCHDLIKMVGKGHAEVRPYSHPEACSKIRMHCDLSIIPARTWYLNSHSAAPFSARDCHQPGSPSQLLPYNTELEAALWLYHPTPFPHETASAAVALPRAQCFVAAVPNSSALRYSGISLFLPTRSLPFPEL